MTHKKKSLWLHFFVYLIIFILMFSVIGVVVIYLNGINEQQVYSVPVTTTPNDESAIQIVPQQNTITVTDNGIEAAPEEESLADSEIDTNTNLVVGDEIVLEAEGEVAGEINPNE